MSERFVSGVSAKIALYKYSCFPFLSIYNFHMALNGLLCVVKKLLSDAVMLTVVEYERKADVRSLEHVDDDLAALRRL